MGVCAIYKKQQDDFNISRDIFLRFLQPTKHYFEPFYGQLISF